MTIVTEYNEVLSESLNLIYDCINLCYFCDVLIRIGVVAVLVGVQYAVARGVPIREIPDHATFREKENTLGLVRQACFVFLSLALCN